MYQFFSRLYVIYTSVTHSFMVNCGKFIIWIVPLYIILYILFIHYMIIDETFLDITPRRQYVNILMART